jgi:Flp pilus assembly protein TadG
VEILRSLKLAQDDKVWRVVRYRVMGIIRRLNRSTTRRGVAAAELAVCLPIVVVLVIATIESCSALFLKQSLTASAYEGVREAIAKGATTASVQTACNQIITDRRIQGSQVKLSTASISTLKPGDFIDVTVSAPCTPNSPVPTTFFRGRTLSAKACMMIEN